MQANLNKRAEKARFAVKAGLLQKIPNGFRVPSRTQVYHHVVLAKFQERDGERGYRMTCHYDQGKFGQWRCPGNRRSVCWHCLAALIAAAKGRPVAFFEDKAEAQRYSHLGGKLCVVWSGDGPKKLYAVVGGPHGQG